VGAITTPVSSKRTQFYIAAILDTLAVQTPEDSPPTCNKTGTAIPTPPSLSDTSLTSLREKFDHPLPFLLSHPSNKHHVELCDAGNIGHTSGLLCVCCTLLEAFDCPYTDRLPPFRDGKNFINRCTKPDRREFIKISQAVGKNQIIQCYAKSSI
jgi:hypothetical protein